MGPKGKYPATGDLFRQPLEELINLAHPLVRSGARIIGSDVEAIDLAEDKLEMARAAGAVDFAALEAMMLDRSAKALGLFEVLIKGGVDHGGEEKVQSGPK